MATGKHMNQDDNFVATLWILTLAVRQFPKRHHDFMI